MPSAARELSRVAIGCSVIVTVAWSASGSGFALPPEAYSQVAGKQAQQVSELVELHKIEVAVDGLGRAIEIYSAALTAEEEAARRAAAIPVDWRRWQRLHQCEQPDTWYANGTNETAPDGLVFQGGLGMSTGAWRMAVRAAAARGVDLPANALAATPEQQMTAAQAFHDAYGWGWGCDA